MIIHRVPDGQFNQHCLHAVKMLGREAAQKIEEAEAIVLLMDDAALQAKARDMLDSFYFYEDGDIL